MHNFQFSWHGHCESIRRDTGLRVVEMWISVLFSAYRWTPAKKRVFYVGEVVQEFLIVGKNDP